METGPGEAQDYLRRYLSIVTGKNLLGDDVEYLRDRAALLGDRNNHLDPSTFVFDEEYYLSHRGAVHRTVHPLEDYFQFGSALGLSPHPLLEVGYVRQKMAAKRDGVVDASENPLVFLLENPDEAPNFLFDVKRYKLSSRFDSAKPVNRPVLDYLKQWRHLQTQGELRLSGFFDADFYNMQAHRQGYELLDPLSHYFSKAPQDRSDCNPKFHGGYYRARYPIGRKDPLAHFLETGARLGNLPNPYADDELGLGNVSAPPAVVEQLLIEYVRLKDRQ